MLKIKSNKEMGKTGPLEIRFVRQSRNYVLSFSYTKGDRFFLYRFNSSSCKILIRYKSSHVVLRNVF